MRVIESCAACLYDKQQRLSDDPAYLIEVREIIQNREENDSAPYLVYLFGKVYEKHFGPRKPYAEIKRRYNGLPRETKAAYEKMFGKDEQKSIMAHLEKMLFMMKESILV